MLDSNRKVQFLVSKFRSRIAYSFHKVSPVLKFRLQNTVEKLLAINTLILELSG